MSEKKPKQQIWGGRMDSSPDELNISFCAGRDVAALPMADEVLLKYDIWTNLAHAKMLRKIGVMNSTELSQIQQSLSELMADIASGHFKLDPAKEDVHINTEHYITFHKKIEAGKKIHTGRSRNDQVTTDMRLYLRDQILLIGDRLSILIESILKLAEEHSDAIMPGFTHYQPAMITTVGHWLTSWSQGLLRDLSDLAYHFSSVNRSPLGSAASFGTSWPIDREFTSELLGFDSVDPNTLDCISSRGENEARVASCISIMMNHFSIIAQDMVLFSTPYYDMIKIDDRYTTGSSIMPQKRNPDFAEIIRSKTAKLHGDLVGILGIQKGSMSGYNRDSQQTKYQIMDLIRDMIDIPIVLSGVIQSLTLKKDKMREKCEVGFMNSADFADWLAREHQLSFRVCYELISLAVKYSDEAGKFTVEALNQASLESELNLEFTQNQVDFLNEPHALLNQKRHTGAPSKESVTEMIVNQKKLLLELNTRFSEFRQKIDRAHKNCFS